MPFSLEEEVKGWAWEAIEPDFLESPPLGPVISTYPLLAGNLE
jgi:hypothetical protein